MIRVKFFTGIALFLFVVTLVSLFTASYIKNSHKAELADGTNSENQPSGSITGKTLGVFLDLEAVSKHNSGSDCYLVISGSVYDVSPFLSAHPGGAKTITPYCGKDGTEAFITKDVSPKRDHSQMAKNMLADYFIGKLGQKIADVPVDENGNIQTNTLPTLTPKAVATPKPTLAPVAPVVTQNSNISLTTDEIAKHNSVSNCWLIISGKVYDVTKYLTAHPGGVSAISRYCGKDGTQGFATKDTGSSHSSYAGNLLNNYLIGTVGQSVPVTTISTVAATPVPTAVPTATPVPATAVPVSQQLTLTTAQIATHNSLSNCWMIVSGKVYDVTRYITQHPGGASAITNLCGQDGTSGFQTKGGRGSNHSNNAYNLLNNYLIGTVGSSISVTPTPATTTPSQTTTPSSSNLPAAILAKYPEATKRSGGYEDNRSWEGKVNTNAGCRAIKVNSSGSISQDSKC